MTQANLALFPTIRITRDNISIPDIISSFLLYFYLTIGFYPNCNICVAVNGDS